MPLEPVVRPGGAPSEGEGWAARIDARDVEAREKSEEALRTHGSGEAGPPLAGTSSQADISAIDDASLFERAIGAIDAGQADQGQRLLEQLVARSPASALADEARRRLSQIYSSRYNDAPHAVASNAPAVPIAPPAETEAAGGPPPAVTAEINDQPAPWRERARRSHRFEGMMSADVGDRIFFSLSSADVGSRARVVLERQARWISRFPELYVVVEGHADDPGDDAANRALSLVRADKARQMLISAGIPAERIDIDPRGRQDRLADCASSQCQAQNRRVLTRLMVVLPPGRGERTGSAEGEAAQPSRLATGTPPFASGPRGDR
ncbi:MAG: OmpA family protein [Hyphomicrobiaceae bacterium]|nr:OmpA family protein [Hyphomicrobiaceae bacterium]